MGEKRIIRPTSFQWDPHYANNPSSLAVERNGLLCISGLSATEFDPERGGYFIRTTNLVQQIEVIFEKMKTIVQEAGYAIQDVVYTVDYALQAALPEYRASGNVRKNVFGSNKPVSVGILVEGIPNSAALLVINAVAMSDGRKKTNVYSQENTSWQETPHQRTFAPGFFVGSEWFWTSGFTGRVIEARTGKQTYPKGILAQTKAIWSDQLGKVLKDASIKPSKVVRVSDYVHPQGKAEYPESQRLRQKALDGAKVASTGIFTHRLLRQQALLETDALCYLGDDQEVIDVPEWQNHYRDSAQAAAVRCGKFVFCAEQGPTNYSNGRTVGIGDLKAQIDQTYDNVRRVLQKAGATEKDVVRTIEFTSPAQGFNQTTLDEARREAFGKELPAVTTLISNQLPKLEADFGMEVWAVLE